MKQQRRTYLAALQTADSGDVGALAELLARVITDNLERFILPAVAGPARMVPIGALVTREISLEALRGAIRRGRLYAVQRSDGQWLSNQKAVRQYLNSRHVHGKVDAEKS